jgi:hypothetical protein
MSTALIGQNPLRVHEQDRIPGTIWNITYHSKTRDEMEDLWTEESGTLEIALTRGDAEYELEIQAAAYASRHGLSCSRRGVRSFYLADPGTAQVWIRADWQYDDGDPWLQEDWPNR